MSGNAVRTYFHDQVGTGHVAVALSHDAMYLFTLSSVLADGTQRVALWDWTDETQLGPRHTVCVTITEGSPLRHLAVHPELPHALVCTGDRALTFLRWDYGGSMVASEADLADINTTLTQSLFIRVGVLRLCGDTAWSAPV